MGSRMDGITAITFALRDESRDFARLLHHSGATGRCGAVLGNLGTHEVLLFHTGMGEARARERLGRFLKEHPIRRLISAGYAGGLDPALPAGALFLAANHSDPRLLAQAQALLGGTPGLHTGLLATATETLETREAKARFAHETGAHAVDMETAVLGGLCRKAGVAMLSLRAISDPAGEELAVPFSVCFDAAKERPRPAALLAFLLRHPSRIPGFLRFASGMGRVRSALAHGLARLVDGLPHP